VEYPVKLIEELTVHLRNMQTSCNIVIEL